MNKRNKIIYWVATVWLSLGMVSTAIVQILHLEEEVANFNKLGYPLYVMNIMAIWKILGVVAILLPRFPLIKEWAYAGFFFAMSGALISHIAVNDTPAEIFGPSLLIVLTVVSWYFRPADRRLNA